MPGSSREGGRRSRWSRSRSRSRGRYERRSRSRSRDRKRSRSRSRGRSKERVAAAAPAPASTAAYDASISAVQAMAAIQQQQQLQRQLLAQQLLLQQQAAAAAAAIMPAARAAASTSSAATADRKAREIYVGNLAIGVVTSDMLRELFNTILSSHSTDGQPPVVNVNLDPSAGRFAFVEFRTRELCDAAVQLDKLELCGRQMNIGRPKGYVDPKAQLVNAATIGQAQINIAAALGQVPATPAPMAAALPVPVAGPTGVVLLQNMVSCGTIRDEAERKEIIDDVYQEVVKCGPVLGLAVPMPPAHVSNAEGCRVYIRYGTPAEAQKCKAMMDGRRFDENQVKAVFVSEGEFNRANAGEWVAEVGVAVPMAPALPTLPMTSAVPSLAGGLPGLAAQLPPAPAPMQQAAGLVLPPGFSLPAGFNIAGGAVPGAAPGGLPPPPMPPPQ